MKAIDRERKIEIKKRGKKPRSEGNIGKERERKEKEGQR
jgi:hypothetical protein